MKKVLIVPGLGDHTGYIKKATRNWPRKYGVEPHVFVFGWSGSVDAYEAKYKRFLQEVARLAKQDKIAVLGISAGTALVMNAAIDLPSKIDSVINICGRVRAGKHGIWSFHSFPLHWKCVEELERKDATKLNPLTIYTPFDEAVPASHVITKGAKNKRVFVALHIPALIWALNTKGKVISKHIKGASA
ncbi:MAG: hypothetical protein ACRD4B_10610 [Acidobacteriota bacterium]